MKIDRDPYAITAGFNPVLLDVELDNGEKYEVLRAAVVFNEMEYLTDAIVESGVAKFDLSGAIKRLFKDLESATTPASANTRKNRLFAVKYNIKIGLPALDDDGDEMIDVKETLPDDLIAVNAVVQIGESSNIGKSDRFTVLLAEQYTPATIEDRDNTKAGLKKYAKYPLTVGYLNIDEDTFVSYDDHIPLDEEPFNDVLFEIDIPDGVKMVKSTENNIYESLTDNSGNKLTDNSGEILYAHNGNEAGEVLAINVNSECTPKNPFYVRWLNHIGSWEYFMFSFRQSIEKSTGSELLFNPYVRDQETAKGFVETAYLEATEQITVGAELLSKREYEALSRIIYSPQIEWYCERLEKWFIITIDDSDVTKDTRNETGSIEITFNLPEPQVQF
jgi:hypothetical protein